MINRKVAKRGLQDDGFWETIEANEKLIDSIYDSIGSCGECISRTEEGGCEIYESLKPNEDFFCADFERKGDK